MSLLVPAPNHGVQATVVTLRSTPAPDAQRSAAGSANDRKGREGGRVAVIEQALHAYTAAAETAFEVARLPPRTRGGLLELRNGADQLRVLVEQLEEGREFNELLEETRSAFRNDWHSSKSESSWRYAIHNFFRRTGYYTCAFAGSDTSGALLQRYEAAFLRRCVQTTYLAPMEFVDFPKCSIS